jgi:hypothetical protein
MDAEQQVHPLFPEDALVWRRVAAATVKPEQSQI